MKKYFFLCCICSLLFSLIYAQELKSPDGKFTMTFLLQGDGTPTYSLTYKGKIVVKQSRLGLELKKDKKSLLNDFTTVNIKTSSFDETWTPVWGEVAQIRSHYNEMGVTLNQKESNRQLIIRFRLFDDGLGFRYEFPQQKKPCSFCCEGRKNTVCHGW